VARKRRRGRLSRSSNYDTSDGIKIHRIHDNWAVSRYKSSFSLWDEDNIVMDNEQRGKGFIHVSTAKQIRKANKKRCTHINGYKGKLNGRS